MGKRKRKQEEDAKLDAIVEAMRAAEDAAIADEVQSDAIAPLYTLFGFPLQPYQAARMFQISTAGKVVRKPLEVRVQEDVEALTADLDFVGRAELPEATLPADSYAAAHRHAVKTCPHFTLEDVVHSSNEYLCTDCQKYVTVAEIHDARRRHGKGMY